MKNLLVPVALLAVVASSSRPALADDDGSNQGVENGADIGAFFGSGPTIDRDAMDEAAERENRKVYLDQDPKSPANISPPVGAGPVSTQATGQPAGTANGQAAAATKAKPPAPTIGWKGDKLENSSQKPQGSKIGRFFRTIGDVLTPNWLIDFGLGPDDDTDTGPDNLNKNY